MKFNLKCSLFPFRYIDLFQQNISLKMKNKYRFSLIIGRFFSLGIIIFILYNAINSDMINKTNPIVLQESLKNGTRPNIELNKDNFLLAFAISDDYSYYPHDPTIFNFALSLTTYKNGNYSYEQIDFELCNQSSLTNFNLVSDLDLLYLFCMKVPNFTLKGYWDEKEMTFLTIDLKRCINNSESNICKSEKEINEFFKIKYLNFFLNQPHFDIKNYENPVLSSIKTLFTGIEVGKRKDLSNYLKKTKVLTDGQIIYESYNEIETYIFEEGTIDLQISDEYLISFIIYSSDYMLVYDRRYEKLFSLLASLGGILHPLLLIGSFIIKYINDWKINELIMNKIYALDVASTQISQNKIANIPKNSIIKNSLKFSLWEKIKYLLKLKKNFSPKETIYHDYLKKSNEKLDLLQVLQKLEEIERLKLVLLNKKQIAIFDYFSKNVLFNENNFENSKCKIKFTIDAKKRNSQQKNKKILENIKQIKQSENPSYIDKNLLRMIDDIYVMKTDPKLNLNKL